jgi:hypothetical protein
LQQNRDLEETTRRYREKIQRVVGNYCGVLINRFL